MRIYCACLASYNAGFLHGTWIDLKGLSAEDIREKISEMLEASPVEEAEEWAMHDSEGFEEINIENPSIDKLVKLVEAIDKHGEAYKAYYSMVGELYASLEDFEDRYIGEYDSLADFAEEKSEDIEIPDNLAYYIDWDHMGQDLVMSEFSSIEANNKHYIFRN